MTLAEDKPVIVERIGHVMLVTINRPQVRNAINQAVHIRVGLALEEAESNKDVRVVILTGAGDKAFCAGADLVALSKGDPLVPDDAVQAGWGFAGFVSHPISKPIIAAVNGFALGGGTELALASDLIVAADTAKFGLPEVKRGLVAGAGGAFRLLEQVPQKIAMEYLLTGDPISADRAQELGLVNQVVPFDELMPAAMALAEKIAANAPLSVQVSKRVALGIVDGKIAKDSANWKQAHKESAVIMKSKDAREGPRAFAEKRAPVWRAE